MDGAGAQARGRDERAIRAERVRQLSLFADLNDEELAPVLAAMHERTLPRGHVIFHEGTPVEAVYFLDAGRVKVSSLTDDGREQILSILRPGEFFPHVGFLDAGPYPGTAVTMEESQVVVLRRSDLLSLLRQNGELALRMMGALAARVASMQQRVKDLTHRHLKERLAFALLRLAEEHGTPAPGAVPAPGVRLGVHLTHEELANMVGAARESVSRCLSEWKAQGLLNQDATGHLILDRRALFDSL